MADQISCSAPNCETQWAATIDSAVLLRLIEMHERTAHPPAAGATPANPSSKAEKVKRPVLTAAGTSEEWAYFSQRWNEYKTASRLTGTDVVLQLLECCDEPLRRDLHRTFGVLINSPELTVLSNLKTLAVRKENVMVARVALQQMCQQRDEPVRKFAARVRGQASVCNFVVKCPCQCGAPAACNKTVSYSDVMVRDTIIRGLEDGDIRTDILSEANQDLSLEDTIKFIEAKESGKRSANTLAADSTSAASEYRKNQRADSRAVAEQQQKHQKNDDNQHQSAPKNETKRCGYCGDNHAMGRKNRKELCSAWGHRCSKCGILGHLEKACRNSANGPRRHNNHNAEIQDANQSSGVFDNLCSIHNCTTSTNNASDVFALEHHVYDNMCQTWLRQRSRPQPMVRVSLQAVQEDFISLGFNLLVNARKYDADVMADTGCQSCLCGMNFVRKMGFSEKDLIPVTMKMSAANNGQIQILGALILRISGKIADGQMMSTRQIVYVSDSTDKFFLSREACVELGIVSSSFPAIGDTVERGREMNSSLSSTATGGERETGGIPIFDIKNCGNVPVSALSDEGELAPCGCLKRTLPPPPPSKMPFTPNEGNREKLKDWLLRRYASSTFNVCPHQKLPVMSGPPVKIMVDPNAEPVVHHKPIPVPLHWQEQVKADLERDVALGIIEKVPIGDPVTWCHQMHVVAKADGSPRRVIDFQALNKVAIRETHHNQSPYVQARIIPANTKKTTFDAWNGYHSLDVYEPHHHYLTFITPWGRYRGLNGMQGYKSMGDAYTRRYDEIVIDVKNMTKCIDDVAQWADDIEEAFHQAVEYIELVGNNGITLNPKKFNFAEDTIEFAGFVVTPDSVKPSGKYTLAINNFPSPKNITDVRSWHGVVNQISYACATAPLMEPFRSLLKPGVPFQWTDELEKSFQASKKIIVEEIENGVKIFRPDLPTCLATDWSKQGIGLWLLQKHCSCPGRKISCCKGGWKTAMVSSRFTTPAESRYAPIEGEALALVEGLEKARFFVLGCPDLTVAVDHKPLLKIFGDQQMEKISNPRLLKLKEKSMRYDFKLIHVPGVKHVVADSLSRNPVSCDPVNSISADGNTLCLSFLAAIRDHSVAEVDVETELKVAAVKTLDSLGLNAVTWDTIKIATASDPMMHGLLELVEDGMNVLRHELVEEHKPYYQYRDKLYSVDGVILYGDRIVVPPGLRKPIIESMHAAHQCVSMMTSRAEASVFWPGITNDIKQSRFQCGECDRIAPSNPAAPPVPPIDPVYPFQCICADFFQHKGVHYLVVVDRYSNWPIVEKSVSGSNGLIACLRRVFSTYGIADEVSSDGGPEFKAPATEQFLAEWGANRRLSSVAFPHSNCRAEIGVKTVKRMLMNNTGKDGDLEVNAFQKAILQYRNTPDPLTKLSPAQCLFGRAIKDFIPIHPGKYLPHNTWVETLADREKALRNRHQRDIERWTEHTRKLPPLKVGDTVRVQNQTGPNPTKWDKTGTVIEVLQNDQYRIRMDGSGRATLRNRRFLRKFLPVYPKRSPISIETDVEIAKARLLTEHKVLDDTGKKTGDTPPVTPLSPPVPIPTDSNLPEANNNRSLLPLPVVPEPDTPPLPAPGRTLPLETPQQVDIQPPPETSEPITPLRPARERRAPEKLVINWSKKGYDT